jgi:hypothetical protein
VSAIAFDQYLSFAGELLAPFFWVADLLALVSAIGSVFVAFLEAAVLVGFLAGPAMALD